MELTDVVIKEVGFELKSLPEHKGKTFRLRPINLEDEIWLKNEYGDQLSSLIENGDIPTISRIVYRLLIEEDKEFFVTREVVSIDEDGNKNTLNLGGVKLFQMCISGWADKITVMKALVDILGVSRPEPLEDVDENVIEQETQKKS